MATDMGRGIMAPDSNDPISTTGVNEMRTLGATTASAISSLDTQVQGELAERVKRDEAEQYGFEGPQGPQGPEGPRGEGEPGPPGPGGSIALEETDPGCFVDSEVTWLQWPQNGQLPAVWNPNTQTHEQPIRVDTSVGTRVFVGDTMIYGDTGWRDISSSLTADFQLAASAGRAIMRRIGNRVSVDLRLAKVGGGYSRSGRWDILSFPNGTRPRGYSLVEGQAHLYSDDQLGVLSTYSGPVRLQVGGFTGTWVDGNSVFITATWNVESDSWPASLFGTPG